MKTSGNIAGTDKVGIMGYYIYSGTDKAGICNGFVSVHIISFFFKNVFFLPLSYCLILLYQNLFINEIYTPLMLIFLVGLR